MINSARRHQPRRGVVQAHLPLISDLLQRFPRLLRLRFGPGNHDIKLVGHLLHIQRRRAGGVGITVAGDILLLAHLIEKGQRLFGTPPVFRPGALVVRNHHRHVAVATNTEGFVQRLENRLKL